MNATFSICIQLHTIIIATVPVDKEYVYIVNQILI